VIGPESGFVGAGGGGYCCGVGEGFFGRVGGGEGGVVWGVPVFGYDFEGEGKGKEVVYGGDYIPATGDGERAVLFRILVFE
jgi:hypothetical protein